MFNDLMDNIEWFFNLHDKNKDGFLSKDEVLTLSESLLVCDPCIDATLKRRLTTWDGSLSSNLKLEMRIWVRSAAS